MHHKMAGQQTLVVGLNNIYKYYNDFLMFVTDLMVHSWTCKLWFLVRLYESQFDVSSKPLKSDKSQFISTM